jgi:hypothetical protein
MAAEIQIGGSDTDRIFLDTDFTRTFEVLDIDTDSTGATAKDITGWAMTLDIRQSDGSSTVKQSFTTVAGLAIAGTFNSVAASNAQRVTWTCADTDITTAIFGPNGGTFRYSLKRTDAGFEGIVQYGDIVIQRATQG